MNQKNFEYLRDQVKFTGFGEGLEDELKKHMQEGKPEFELFHNTSFGEDKLSAVLSFRKSEQQERYYFNKYLAVVRPVNPLFIAEQTFYINKGSNVTLKEAYNLLRGRAVEKELTNKEGVVYRAWLQLDFRQQEPNGNYKVQQFHQNYGFNLEKALAQYPIRELADARERDQLLASLRKGNLQAVTLTGQDGKEVQHFVEASPQYKSVNVYNESRRRLLPSVAPEQAIKEGQLAERKQHNQHQQARFQQAPGGGEDPPSGKRRSVRKGKSIGS